MRYLSTEILLDEVYQISSKKKPRLTTFYKLAQRFQEKHTDFIGINLAKSTLYFV